MARQLNGVPGRVRTLTTGKVCAAHELMTTAAAPVRARAHPPRRPPRRRAASRAARLVRVIGLGLGLGLG
eukprot:scaffold53486_cov49-Phaeocystis_antarctica.AAC.2